MQFTNVLGRLANVSVVLPMCLVVWPTYSVVLPTYSVRFANVFGQLTIAVGRLSQEKKIWFGSSFFNRADMFVDSSHSA